VAAPPGFTAPPLPPHLPEQRLAASILPAQSPHANHGGSWSARQQRPQQPLVGQHAAGGSPGRAAQTQPQAARPGTGRAALAASQPSAGTAGCRDGSIQRSAAPVGSADARQLPAAQGVLSPSATSTVSNAVPSLPAALWPPYQRPAQPQLPGTPVAPGVPPQLLPHWLPPPGGAWSAPPSAAMALLPHGPQALALPPQPVPPHPPQSNAAGGGPQTSVPASAARSIGALGMAGYPRPSLPPLQGRGAPHAGHPVAGGLQLRPPQPTGQAAAGVHRPMLQHMHQPYSASPDASGAQRIAGTSLHAALNYVSSGRPPPQQWLPAAGPLQQWAQQLPRGPGTLAPPPYQVAGSASGAGGLGPTGPRIQPQPAQPSSQGAQLPISKQQLWAATPRLDTQTNGVSAMHHAQVQQPLLPPPLRLPGSQTPAAGRNAPSGAVALQPSLSIASAGVRPAAVATASAQPRNELSVTVPAVATAAAKPKGAKSCLRRVAGARHPPFLYLWCLATAQQDALPVAHGAARACMLSLTTPRDEEIASASSSGRVVVVIG